MNAQVDPGGAILDRAALTDRLTRFERRTLPLEGRRHAAVTIVVGDDAQGRGCLVLTRRGSRLSSHRGQWALPGGRLDEGESPVEAALRETREEIGLHLPADAVLGILDDYATRSGYLMTPIVAWAGRFPPLVAGETEVEAIHLIPLADLDVPAEFVRIPESSAPVIRLPLFGGHLHAPTAAVVHQFCEVGLRDRPTRVAHLEQPVFAWR